MNIIRRESPTPSLATWDPFRSMRDILRWDPFREMMPMAFEREAQVFVPDVDILETPDAYVFRADLPGIKEKDIEISLTGSRLTITGKREEERRDEGDTYFTCERSYGAFTRSFTLPVGADAEHVDAEMRDGVLTLNVQKKPEMQPKRIEVHGAQSQGGQRLVSQGQGSQAQSGQGQGSQGQGTQTSGQGHGGQGIQGQAQKK